MAERLCPHCGKRPYGAIKDALDGCEPGDGFEQLTHCDRCGGEIAIAVSKKAYVQRRGRGHSDAELDALSAARHAGRRDATEDRTDG